MAEISDEELDGLRAAAAERDQMKATPPPAGDDGEGRTPEPTHVALLLDGTRYPYSGAHPTHVDTGDKDHPHPVPVIAVHSV